MRLVPLTEEAEALLRAAPRSSVYVFPGRFGGMMARNACSLNRIVRRSVPAFTLRRLRHTFGSRTIEAGLTSDLLRIAMGHSTVKMTGHYARPSDEVVWEKMRALSPKLLETGDSTGDNAPLPLAKEVGKA